MYNAAGTVGPGGIGRQLIFNSRPKHTLRMMIHHKNWLNMC